MANYLLGGKAIRDLLLGNDPSTAALKAWMEKHAKDTLWTTWISVGQLSSDIHAIGDADQRTKLMAEFNETILTRFEKRTLPFDQAASREWSVIRRAKVGTYGLSSEISQVVAIARARSFIYVGESSPVLEQLGIAMEDPWAKAETEPA